MQEKKDESPIEEVIFYYHHRAGRLRAAAARYRYLAVFILFLTVFTFFFAEKLFPSEKQKQLNMMSEKIASEHEGMNALLSAIINSKFNMERDSFDKLFYVDSFNHKEIYFGGTNLTKTFHNMYNTLERLDTINLSPKELNIDFLSALSTKIGSILIMIFVVQILLRSYRYDIRLANYYEARALGLRLHVAEPSLPFDKIISLLSPDIYDVGNIKSPAESLVSAFGNNKLTK